MNTFNCDPKFRTLFRDRMYERRMTRKELATKCGIRFNSLLTWINGRSGMTEPTFDMLCLCLTLCE